MKLYINPHFTGDDPGDGGIRRVCEAQQIYLPRLGIEVVDDIDAADICAYHGGVWLDAPGKPVVSHCHGLYWQEYEWSQWAHSINRAVVEAMRRADTVTAPSEWVAYILQRGMALDAKVLYHGIELDDWPYQEWAEFNPAQDYVLWNKARVDAICDPEPLDRLAELAPDVKFVSTFGRPASNVELSGKLSYIEAKKQVQNAYVYLCTTRETFGIGTLEAMASGSPVLAFNWGGQAEFIEHGVTGWLAAPGDYAHLLEGLRYIMANRERMSKAARAMVSARFTWPQQMERYAQVYRQTLFRHNRLMQGPKVSVIVTCYNLASTLERAVDSALTQEQFSPADTEVVIVNDNSPDDTAKVAKKLVKKYGGSGAKIKVVTNETNLYLAGALNAGITASSGQYIVPLDADNELGPRALRVLSDVLDRGWKNPNTPASDGIEYPEIVYGAMQVIDETGDKAAFISGWPGQFNYSEQMRHHNQIPSTSMYKRRVWERTGGYRRRCRTAEDADFWCRATSAGFLPRRITDAVTLVYHDRADSMSHVERDWDWTAWYPWSRDMKLTPFGAATDRSMRINAPTYQPEQVTVIIPMGPGHAKYLIDAIDSVVAQTYQNWRIIVINDSLEPMPWVPPFVQVIESGGVGPARARNLGIAASRTPLFLPLDADDYLHPDALSVLLAYMRRTEGKSYVYSDWYVQETGEEKQVENFDCELIRHKLPHSVTALYPRAAWKECGGFDEQLESWEDWDFVLGLVKAGYCGVRVARPLFYYRMEAGTRREDKYANKEKNLAAISAKWSKWLVEGEPMGCGCAGSSYIAGAPILSANGSNGNGMAGATADGSLVLVEYVGGEPARTYKGQSTGTDYRFGNDDGNRVRYVHKADLDIFTRLPDFKQGDIAATVVLSDVQLEAKGPPERSREAVPA